MLRNAISTLDVAAMVASVHAFGNQAGARCSSDLTSHHHARVLQLLVHQMYMSTYSGVDRLSCLATACKDVSC